MSKNKEVRLRKIALDVFIQALLDVYNSGVDYIDIVGKADEEQDTIGIAFCEDYMSKERSEETFEDLKEEIKNINLSDDDLNQLS